MTKCRAQLKKSFNGLIRFWTRKCWKGEKWQDEEIDHFVSSYGNSPGHEANYMALNRLFWHLERGGKARK